MSRKSDPITEFFNSLKGKNNTNNEELTIENLFNNENVQNLLKNEKTKNTLMNFASQISAHVITPSILRKILDTNPDITNEWITEQINLFKKDHPESNDIINKYLYSYEEKRSNEYIYNMRKFAKSDDCKKALDDPQIKQYIKEIINSPNFKDKIQELNRK